MDELLSWLGLGDYAARELFFAQIALMSVIAVLFLASLGLCIMAFQAAGAARRSRVEAFADLASTRELADEVRRLSADIERTARDRRDLHAALTPHAPTVETQVAADASSDRGEESSAYADEWSTPSNASLEAAARSATVPAALVGSLLRRRE